MLYRPALAAADPRRRAALAIYSTLLGGSMGSRLFEEIREKRGLCYSVYAVDHAFADLPVLQLGSGLDSAKCIEAYTRMREIVDELRDSGPTEAEVQRARAYAAGRRVLAFENSGAVARVGGGVYAVGYARLTREGRYLAAVLDVGPGAVLSHTSAAVQWGFLEDWPNLGRDIHVTVARRVRPRRGIRVHRTSRLDTADTT